MSFAPTTDRAATGGSGRQANMPWITPYLMVRDVTAALEFYETAFGFQRRGTHAGPDGVVSHGSMTWQGDGVVMMGLQGAYGGTTMAPTTAGSACPISIYVYCADVDALVARARNAGAEVKFEPMDTFYGDRICNLVDRDGYVWCFATNRGTMPDPGQN